MPTAQVERKSEKLIERIVEADSPSSISTYEAKLRKLEEQKVALQENVSQCGRPLQSFDGVSL